MRVLIFIVAYNAETTIQNVIRRIDPALAAHDTHVLVIDDCSTDQTFARAREFTDIPFPMTVLFNPVNLGYGGNQKIGFHYAIRERFDVVALVHGDGQYAPECLNDLLQPLLRGEADAVFGSRMMAPQGALRGGMPVYKFVGNRILTGIQNRLLKTGLSEFHSGYRLYSVEALAKLPFDRNTNQFHFDTEIIIQLLRAGCRIKELPIPTYYGDEICRVNGLKYAWDVLKATVMSRAQDFGILYDRKYDIEAPGAFNPLYQAKFHFESPHTMALERVPAGSKVLDIGCASGYIARALREKGCEVTGIDQFPPPSDAGLAEFIRADLSISELPADAGAFDYVLLLDVIEHIRSPEAFVEGLRRRGAGRGRAYADRQHWKRGLPHDPAVPPAGEVSLWPAWNSGSHAYPAFYICHDARSLRTGGLPRGRGEGGAGPVSAGLRRQLVFTGTAVDQPRADPSLEVAVCLSDFHGGSPAALARLAVAKGGGNWQDPRRSRIRDRAERINNSSKLP